MFNRKLNGNNFDNQLSNEGGGGDVLLRISNTLFANLLSFMSGGDFKAEMAKIHNFKVLQCEYFLFLLVLV